MTIVSLAACLSIAICAIFVFLIRRKKTELFLFNRSRSKKTLVEETRRRFTIRKWVVKSVGMVSLDIDFCVKSPMAVFYIACLDPMLNRFRSELSILERLENLAKDLRLRREYLIVVTADDLGDGFASSAHARGVSLIPLAGLESVTRIIDYADHLPDAVDAMTLRALEANPSACADLMYRFKKAGDNARAVEWGSRALKSYPGYFIHYSLFSLLIENNDFERAKQVGEEALSYKPKEAFLFFQGLQKIAALTGDETGEVTWAERWTKVEPDNAMAYGSLAGVYQNQGDARNSALAIDKALELAPTDPDILRKAVTLARKDGDLATAASRAEQWVTHAAEDVGARDVLADILLKQARYEEAAVVVAGALVIDPNRPSLLRKASLVALQRGDFPSATQFAEQWLAVAPNDGWAHDHLCALYLRSANYEQARDQNSRALKLDPTNSNFLRRAEQIRAKAG